jgi:hypothetical protein
MLLVVMASLAWAQPPQHGYTKPKVRAITGFVRLDRAGYRQEVAEALAVLRAAKSQFEQQGYEVQTLRIVTQPLSERRSTTFPSRKDFCRVSGRP